jgi:parvulin-like peptidyl-prolyl isomerase
LAKREEKQPREFTRRQVSHAKKQALRQRIILFGGISVIVVVVLLIFSGWLFGEFLPLNKVVAKVYDTNIRERQLIDVAVAYGSTQTSFDVTQNLDNILQGMMQNILTEREAAKLGITVTDQELEDAIKGTEYPDGYKSLIRASLVTNKLRQDYFNKQLPDSGNQVLMNAMLVESEELVPAIKARLLSGDNFTALAGEFALNSVSKDNGGVFDWHPASLLYSEIGTSIPVDWAFSENVVKGQISDALSDNGSSKQLGYWLIKVNEKPVLQDTGETSANVSAILLSSEAQAARARAELESGADLGALADTLSQYTASQEAHGTWNVLDSDNISASFNGFTFDLQTPVGVWSQPIKDTQLYTNDGAWIVQVVDKSDQQPYSTTDKSTMVDTAYTDWVTNLWSSSASNYSSLLDDAARKLAIDRITAKLNR